jgi:peptidoglycan hydrolase-like protein with peptidoglycan-binding domain
LLVRSAQQALADRGYDVGLIDGQLGPKTADALRKFQSKTQLPVTGRLDSQTIAALHLEATAPISMNGANV